MSEEKSENQSEMTVEEPAAKSPAPKKRSFLSRRRVLAALAAVGGVCVLLAIVGLVAYRYGVLDTYIKDQFVSKLSDIGVDFSTDSLRLTVSPLALELRNATFNDKVSGEKLIFIRRGYLGLTISDLLAWQLSREISIDTTDIEGAEVWVKFDENGRSNFSNLTFVEEEGESSISFRYTSMKLRLTDSIVHVGDVSRKISGDANNIQAFFEPEDAGVPDEEKNYKFEVASTNSRFIYDESVLNEINIRSNGSFNREGAQITELRIDTPVGTSALSGTITDWSRIIYDLNIESTVDLTQTSTTFPLGTAISGIGNFMGKVSGSGENYRIDGRIDSESLSADGIYLKGIDIEATVAGTNLNYDANGRAVAELLTFEDFRIEFPKIAGNVRGTGTDFRWVGELQAASAKFGSLGMAGLFVSDAVAELKDKKLTATAGNARTQMFSVGDTEIDDLSTAGLRLTREGDVTSLSAPSARAGAFRTEDYDIRNIEGRELKVRDAPNSTTIDIEGLKAAEANAKGTKLRNLTAKDFRFKDQPNSIDLSANDLRAERLDADGTRIDDLYAETVTLKDNAAETVIYSNKTRIAKLETGGAILGSLNVAGVRLTIRQGRVEVRSEDIDAGTVQLASSDTLPEGGTLEDVKIAAPVYVLERSGRYRASADMSLGGGIIGSIPLGNARALVSVTNDGAELNELVAEVMDGRVEGSGNIAFSTRNRSNINANFTGLELSKLIAMQAGRVFPFEGTTNGTADLSFDGTDFSTTSGRIKADIAANAGSDTEGRIPVNGTVELAADMGLFNIDRAQLKTERSELSASGRFDLREDRSDMNIALDSSDAEEIDRLVRVLNVSPTLTEQLDTFQVRMAGDLQFDGRLTGSLASPLIDGRASLASLSMRGRELGAVSTDINVGTSGVTIDNGRLSASDGGSVTFAVNIPYTGTNNISVDATLSDVNAGSLLAALPADLPENLRDFTGRTSGTIKLEGLPNESRGDVNISASSGTLGGQPFDGFSAKAVFSGTLITIEKAGITASGGELTASGSYDHASSVFDLKLDGDNIPLPLLLSFLPPSESMPSITGVTKVNATARGNANDPATFFVQFDGAASDVVINENPFGEITFKGNTVNNLLTADLTAMMENRPQTFSGSVNFGSPDMPFRVEHVMSQSQLGPFFALLPQLRGIDIKGVGTGKVEFGGNLASRNEKGEVVYSAAGLSGSANFSQLSLQLQDTPLVATEPVAVRFSTGEIEFQSVRFSGAGSNLTIAGTKALTDNGMNNLAIDGRINLAILNVFPGISSADTFFAGFSTVSMRLSGINKTARLSGTANLENAVLATFIGASRLSMDRLQGRVLFTSNQAQIDSLTGYLGGGKFTATGGALINDDLSLGSYRVSVVGSNVTVPLPENFITTGDVRLDISGRRIGSNLTTLIDGTVLARRSIYSQDIDLADLISGRREGSLSGGASTGLAPRFNLTISGRNALIVRNNIADLTASADLRLTGTTSNPQISGRITANSGTVFFRRDRYDVQRAVVEFPPNTTIEPVVFLQAETEIQGYQIFVNLSGSLTDTESLNFSVRSSPALPQQDVVSLVTTGSLSNTESGIPTLASTGINTAAEVLTDSIINEPARRATDRLFGLNVFEIDPIISGERLNPSARLTVGRQINNNLRVTYSTNLSQDQNQVLALEYRLSNKMSLVAQYEQQSLSNVTRERNSFSFEVRFRRRF
ncbi:MAG: translocation/assembly module TamB domain-containing protein [Acidobacteria bacterium]|nr:translocation/assembly module TamB domain-containing protein [Acidobacteriota bacterium]